MTENVKNASKQKPFVEKARDREGWQLSHKMAWEKWDNLWDDDSCHHRWPRPNSYFGLKTIAQPPTLISNDFACFQFIQQRLCVCVQAPLLSVVKLKCRVQLSFKTNCQQWHHRFSIRKDSTRKCSLQYGWVWTKNVHEFQSNILCSKSCASHQSSVKRERKKVNRTSNIIDESWWKGSKYQFK